MTYKVQFAASARGGYLLNPEAYVNAESFSQAHDMFLEWAKKELERYSVTITSIHTDSAYIVEGESK